MRAANQVRVEECRNGAATVRSLNDPSTEDGKAAIDEADQLCDNLQNLTDAVADVGNRS